MGIKSKFGWLKFGWLTVPNSAICEPRLSSVELRVLMYLGIFKIARPTLAQITAATGIPERSVCRALAELRDMGMVTWRTGHMRKANVYTVSPLCNWELSHRGPGRVYSQADIEQSQEWCDEQNNV